MEDALVENIPIEFYIPTDDGSFAIVRTVDCYRNNKLTIFCVDANNTCCYRTTMGLIHALKDPTRKGYVSDVIIQKIEEKYIIKKSRYGKCPRDETLYADPVK